MTQIGWIGSIEVMLSRNPSIDEGGRLESTLRVGTTGLEAGMILHNLLPSDELDGVPYLFRSKSNVVEFTVIEEEMEELNEFCYACDQAAIKLIDDANERVYLSAPDAEFDESFSSWFRDMDMLRWHNVQEIVVAGMVVILVFAFVERHLKRLCMEFGPDDFNDRKLRRHGGKIDAFISHLQIQCGFQFSEPGDFQNVKLLIRPLRNAFVHGDWDEFSKEVENVDLSKVFAAVSGLFTAIERASY